jgi:hypothetical protein
MGTAKIMETGRKSQVRADLIQLVRQAVEDGAHTKAAIMAALATKGAPLRLSSMVILLTAAKKAGVIQQVGRTKGATYSTTTPGN